jgi:hypothetical protein
MELVLYRGYLEKGTNGALFYNGAFVCFTIELPWNDNKKGLSCIPEGTYTLGIRQSVKFQEHLIVQGVVGRASILIHPANNALKELRGCIAPVSKITGAGTGTNSRKAMQSLLTLLKPSILKKEKIHLTIKKGNYEISRTN